MKNSVILTCILCTPLLAQAAESPDEAEYSYGQTVDVKEVVSVQTLTVADASGVVKQKMIYKDSQGQEHALVYEAVSRQIY